MANCTVNDVTDRAPPVAASLMANHQRPDRFRSFGPQAQLRLYGVPSTVAKINSSSLLSSDIEIDCLPLPQPVQELLQGGRWSLSRPRAPVAPQHDPWLQPRPDAA
jgi:hypothetical protein